MARSIFTAVALFIIVVAYAILIATLVTRDAPKSHWHWPAGEVSITYIER